MKVLLLALVLMCVKGDDDLFNPYIHTKTMLKRFQKVKDQNKKNEKALLQLEGKERKLLNVLDIMYRDMKIAVSMKDRFTLEQKVGKLQKGLTELRQQKRAILRKMRHSADKVASPERDRFVRKARIEKRIGLETSLHLNREVIVNQKKLLKVIEFFAHKYAKMASEIAASKMNKEVDKKGGDILKAQHKFKKAAKHAYNKYYKKIVKRLEEATADGVETKDIKMECRSAIDGLIRRLEHQYLTYVKSRKEASKEAKKAIKKPLRKSMKKLSKSFEKKAVKAAAQTAPAKKDVKDVKAPQKTQEPAKK
ncbi:hypothetical protein EIN_231040 [Entamoeba invadens IP1]|uniref:Axoneme-associated protein mst101 n=2 Tax=Entamoeba invadens TaxID=33085 RepID=A0A0A1U346_ENTIV|nr:hypothetical protein EIN_231040 [Entamoeba invadens IP1]ELP88481.1 hypothetical protein EIN_231040 [Entamoeba invadens IP1]BAN42343.1 hypothetical protein [Entamoeba invadens]|eukprot:XP_004255252.1 hypothetical protein EIN_231040 [Entamoeba invadens IP1]